MVIEMGCKLGDDGKYKNCMFHNSNGTCESSKKKCEYDDTFSIKKCGRVLGEGETEYCDRCYTKMKCPRCGRILSYNGKKGYVDLSEHVSCCENDPTWQPDLRPTWHCSKCYDIFRESFYDDEGIIYNSFQYNIPNKYRYALDSFWFKYHIENCEDEKLLAELMALPDDKEV